MRIKRPTTTSGNTSCSSCPISITRLLIVFAVFMIGLNAAFLVLLLSSSSSSMDDSKGASRTAADVSSDNKPPTSLFRRTNNDKNKQPILDIFQEAQVDLTSDMIDALPTWSQVQEVLGTHPYLLNLDSCRAYREKVPPLERMLGSAGIFNTGTNLVTHLLKQNCEIPERRAKYGPRQSKESYGMRWQVPWGKHTPAKFRKQHATEKAASINKEYILPVVTIRNPYSWFKSMCKTSYAARWDHGMHSNCPLLKYADNNEQWNPVNVRYGADREDSHLSLGHMWNDWYSYYLNEADYPFVVVRMEDLVVYPKETITQVCECAGGQIRTDQPFKYVVDSAKKDSPGHDKTTGIYQAWIKYAQRPQPMGGLSKEDYLNAQIALNQTLMELLGYHHPPPS